MPNIQQRTSKVQEKAKLKPLSIKAFNFSTGTWEYMQLIPKRVKITDDVIGLVYEKIGDPSYQLPLHAFNRAKKDGWIKVLSPLATEILFGSQEASA